MTAERLNYIAECFAMCGNLPAEKLSRKLIQSRVSPHELVEYGRELERIATRPIAEAGCIPPKTLK